jgi:hypothetical protein
MHCLHLLDQGLVTRSLSETAPWIYQVIIGENLKRRKANEFVIPGLETVVHAKCPVSKFNSVKLTVREILPPQ